MKLDSSKAVRYFLPVSLITLLVMSLIISVIFERRVTNNVAESTKKDMVQALDVGNAFLTSTIEQFKYDINFLKDSAALLLVVRSIETNDNDSIKKQPKKMLEKTFAAFMQQQAQINQLRVISNDEGNELVRVDRVDNQIVAVPNENLQNKFDRVYFEQSSQLSDGEIYISPINLNRENGQIQYPLNPTLRLAVPIFFENGESVGILIMNINASFLIEGLIDVVDSRFPLYLLNSADEFILHPNPQKSFCHELGVNQSWNTEFAPANEDNGLFQVALSVGNSSQKIYYLRTKIGLSGTGESDFISLVISIPEIGLTELKRGQILSIFGFALVILCFLIVLVYFFQMFIKRSVELSVARLEHEAIINGSLDAIIGLDFDGRVTSWNTSAETFFAKEFDSVKGVSIDHLCLFGGIKLLPKLERVNQNEPVGLLEAEIGLGNNVRCLSVSLSPIKSDTKKILGTAVIVKDISIQKQSENQIKAINQSLESQVKERTQELEKAKDQAMQVSRIKSEFISNVSHEMRTPLNGIAGTLELIKNESLSESQSLYMEMTESSINNLSNLINDILDMSKIEAGKLDFEFEPFVLAHTIESLCSTFALKADDKGLTFIVDTSSIGEPNVIGDKNRLKQILNNLLSNAMKFTAEGEIVLTAKTELINDEVVFTCSVEDSGIGIALENQHKLFNIFTQENNRVAGKFGGTGLGLAISKQLCQRMGGDIGLVSAKNQGSTFTFSVRFKQVLQTEETITNPLKDMTFRILDDNQREKNIIETILRNLGATILDESQDVLSDVVLVDQTHSVSKTLTIANIHTELNCLLAIRLQTIGQFSSNSKQGLQYSLLKPLVQSALIKKLADNFISNTILQEYCEQQSWSRQRHHTDQIDLSNVTVLVVDDNDINVEVAKGMIMDSVNKVFSASDGTQAIDLLKRIENSVVKIDVILMDCNMPIMNGFECTKLIRLGEAGERFKNIPIIAVTAAAMSGEKEKCLKAGMNDFLTKPIIKQQMLKKISIWSQS